MDEPGEIRRIAVEKGAKKEGSADAPRRELPQGQSFRCPGEKSQNWEIRAPCVPLLQGGAVLLQKPQPGGGTSHIPHGQGLDGKGGPRTAGNQNAQLEGVSE